MRNEIKLVRQLGAKRDEIAAYQVMIQEEDDESRRTGVSISVLSQFKKIYFFLLKQLT
jgi:L-ribulose-5-phosphate 3-epimerase UlaE